MQQKQKVSFKTATYGELENTDTDTNCGCWRDTFTSEKHKKG